jgi:nucleoside-triphosphatase THEP1
VVTLDGKRGELADKYSVHGPCVGSYRVNVESFERVALPSLEFVRRVREIFHAGYTVLATIPLRGGGEFLEEIRRQRDVKTFIVTIENRGALPAQLAAMLLGATD